MNSTPETVAFHGMSIHLNGVDLKNKECPGKRRPRATKKVCTPSSDLSGGLCPQPPCPGEGLGTGQEGRGPATLLLDPLRQPALPAEGVCNILAVLVPRGQTPPYGHA